LGTTPRDVISIKKKKKKKKSNCAKKKEEYANDTSTFNNGAHGRVDFFYL
jgi:hypothetical protein